MIEANNTRAGFFSSIFQVLNYCHRAEILNDDIKINKFSLCYLDRNMGYDTSFHQYFEDTKNINKNLKYPIKFNYLSNIECPTHFHGVIICGFILDYELRKYISFLIDKYLIIKKDIIDKINDKYENFKDKKTLGLHIRQTDHNEHGTLISSDTYISEVMKIINDYDMLYVMSDNNEDLNMMKNVFQDKIYILDDVIRTGKRDGTPAHYDKQIKNRYKLGEDILIETTLMSKCDTVIMSNSNICNFVMAKSPDIKYKILDLNLSNI